MKKSKIWILVYHETQNDILDPLAVNLDTFEKHMSFLQDNFKVISLSRLVKCQDTVDKNETNVAVITFDDGYLSNYLYALPILEKYNFHATFFVATSYIDKSPRFMSWEQIKELSDRGYAIGSHTITHRNLATLKKSDIRKEIIGSKLILEKKIGKKVNLFAFPFGKEQHATKETISIVKNAGYECCCSTTGHNGIPKENLDLFHLRRIPVNNMGLKDFKNLMENSYFWAMSKKLRKLMKRMVVKVL